MSIRACSRYYVQAVVSSSSTRVLTRLCVLAILSIAAQHVHAGPTSVSAPLRHDIPSGTLDTVLQEFANRSNVQLLYSPALVRGRHSPGLQGHYAPASGLARLLAEHGLTAIAVKPGTYLLQSAAHSGRPAGSAASQSETGNPASVTELAPVDVTGTRIPRTSLELSFPMTVITADDIERSGSTTLYDLLSQQPGLVSHHPVAIAREGMNYPLVVASGASLYSFGPRATLYLVNGMRVAQFGLASGDLGGIVDLNGIPLSFIDRIEILRGGASAIYGADAMAGTINIILKKDYTGSEISFRTGVSQRGDARSRQASTMLGTQTRSGGNLLLAASITSQDELAGEQRDWHTIDGTRFGLQDERLPLGFFDSYGESLLALPQCRALGENPASQYCRYDSERYRTLQPGLLNKSLYMRWDQALGSSLTLHFSGLRTQSEQTLQHRSPVIYVPMTPSHPDYANAPAGTDYVLFLDRSAGPRNHSASTTDEISIGLEGRTREWSWNIALSHSDSRVHSTIDNALVLAKVLENLSRVRVDGSDNTDVMNAMRSIIRPAGYNSIDTLEATSNRRLFDAPGGPVRFEMGVALHFSHRRNAPDPLQLGGRLYLGSDTQPYNLNSRDSAVFAELDLPLHRTLQADLAIRLDHHDGFQTNTSPRIGMRWTPNPSLLVRASLGQGYRAPGLNDQRAPFADLNNSIVFMHVSPELLPCIRASSRYCRVEYGVADNPHLRAEYSRSLTMGMVWAPTNALHMSLDGYRILRTDEFGVADAFRYPSLFPGGLVRDANGVLYRVNRYLANIGKSEARGWEFESNYFLRNDRLGEFSFHLAAHHLNQYIASSIMQPVPIDRAGHDTPKLTVLGNVKWRRGHWTTTLAMRHFGPTRAYLAGQTCPQINRDAGRCTNPPATLLGVNAEYSGPNGWSYSLDVNNLLDRTPVNYRSLTGGYNVGVDDVIGRHLTLGATYRF